MSVELMVMMEDDVLELLETTPETADAVFIAMELWRELNGAVCVIRDERTKAVKATMIPFWMNKDIALLQRSDGTNETLIFSANHLMTS